MKKKPNGFFTVLIAGALVRLHQTGYSDPRAAECFHLLAMLGIVDINDQTSRASANIAYHSAVIRQLRHTLWPDHPDLRSDASTEPSN